MKIVGVKAKDCDGMLDVCDADSAILVTHEQKGYHASVKASNK